MDTDTLAQAIARAEGFYVAGSIPQRANNPGDLEVGDVGHGKLGEGITVFANPQAGWQALYHQVDRMLLGLSKVYLPSMTLAQVGMKYSGDPNWAKNVAEALGVDESITLAQLAALPSPPS